eukprot:CAMPEP_0113503094 /NCGR_PEP_ID=MMETSP0014_2-20120614/33947_1 /TAXON_ID=2857 /ORGANISM="Nitzschia sp." /LENGTH=71 /DNA_ID=CAMNT_0000398011 /DNA_START=44 /DNA_END=259 /DNA_ORIENTATION=- /assembly_acc=CAM_ASM_000159
MPQDEHYNGNCHDDDDDGLWEKPAWAKSGGLKLKSTGKADMMKKDGNLASPITKIRDDRNAVQKIKDVQHR